MKLYSTVKDTVIFIIVILGFLYIVEKYVFEIPHYSSNTLESSNEVIVREDEEKKYKIKTITKVLWCENRASKTSMELVLSVIINRAKEKSIDGLYAEVVKPFQFSCLNDEKIIHTQRKTKKDLAMYDVAEEIVHSFVNGQFKSITTATFYYAPKKVINLPKYLETKPLLLAFEDHHFH